MMTSNLEVLSHPRALLESESLSAGALSENAQNVDIQALQQCLQLAQEAKTEALAVEIYEQLRDRLIAQLSEPSISMSGSAPPDLVALLDIMWNAVLSSHRSVALWQHLYQTEQQLTDQMAESHVQLQQNYLRLIQEQ